MTTYQKDIIVFNVFFCILTKFKLNLMNKLFFKTIIIIVLGSFNLTNAQKIARHMLSSQGATIQLTNGQVITQTIGQNSIIGSFNGNNGIQGFQQPLSSKLTVLPEELKLKLVVYPNPFTEILKVNIPDIADRTLFLVQIFDSSGGRLLYSQNIMLENNTLSLEPAQLNPAAYILKVSSDRVNFSTVVFKK
jgi:hypothetical protein